MSNKTTELKFPSEHSDIEKKILLRLYEYPDAHSADGFLQLWYPNVKSYEYSDELVQARADLLHAIETLVEQGLAEGERRRLGEFLLYEKVQLTKPGVRKAITLKRTADNIEVQHIGSSEPNSDSSSEKA